MWELSHLTHFFRFLYFEAFLHLNTDLSHSPAWFSSKSFLLPLYLGIISSTLIWYQASVEILYIVLFQFLFSHTSDCLISCSDSSIMQLKLSCCQHQLPVIPYCLLLLTLLTLRHYHFPLREREDFQVSRWEKEVRMWMELATIHRQWSMYEVCNVPICHDTNYSTADLISLTAFYENACCSC